MKYHLTVMALAFGMIGFGGISLAKGAEIQILKIERLSTMNRLQIAGERTRVGSGDEETRFGTSDGNDPRDVIGGRGDDREGGGIAGERAQDVSGTALNGIGAGPTPGDPEQ